MESKIIAEPVMLSAEQYQKIINQINNNFKSLDKKIFAEFQTNSANISELKSEVLNKFEISTNKIMDHIYDDIAGVILVFFAVICLQFLINYISYRRILKALKEQFGPRKYTGGELILTKKNGQLNQTSLNQVSRISIRFYKNQNY